MIASSSKLVKLSEQRTVLFERRVVMFIDKGHNQRVFIQLLGEPLLSGDETSNCPNIDELSSYFGRFQ
jgi:hypothetical protein